MRVESCLFCTPLPLRTIGYSDWFATNGTAALPSLYHRFSLAPFLCWLLTVCSGSSVLHVSKWLAVKRVKILVKPRPKQYPDQQGLAFSFPWEGFTDISKIGLRVMDVLEQQQPFILLPFWNISQPRCWNWRETHPKISR